MTRETMLATDERRKATQSILATNEHECTRMKTNAWPPALLAIRMAATVDNQISNFQLHFSLGQAF